MIPGLTVSGYWGAFTAATLVTIVNAVAWPYIYNLSAKLNPILFPSACFLLTAAAMLIIAPINEALSDEFPNLVLGLQRHPGISFLLVRPASEGGLVVGASGGYTFTEG